MLRSFATVVMELGFDEGRKRRYDGNSRRQPEEDGPGDRGREDGGGGRQDGGGRRHNGDGNVGHQDSGYRYQEEGGGRHEGAFRYQGKNRYQERDNDYWDSPPSW
jgi:hypothetical protein